MKKNENGFSAAEVLISVLVIVLVSFLGWYVWSKNSTKNNSAQSSTSITSNNSQKDHTNQENKQTDISKKGKQVDNDRFTIDLPEGWNFEKKKGDLKTPDNETYSYKNENNYLWVNLVQYGKDSAQDISWTYELTKERTVLVKESPTIICSVSEDLVGFCGAGDGNLSIFINPAQTIKFNGISEPIYVSFYAGNSASEDPTKAKLEDIKSILNSIQFKD